MQLKLFLCGLKTSILKKNKVIYLYIYNKYYYTLIKLHKENIIKLPGANITLYNTSKTYDSTNSIIPLNQKIKDFIYQLSKTFFAAIKCTGKGYKIKKNSTNSIMLLFNRSHITTIW